MALRNLIFFAYATAFVSCSNAEINQSDDTQHDTTSVTKTELNNPEFPFADFADSVAVSAQKNGFDTLKENGVKEIVDFNNHRYLGMVIRKNELQKSDYDKIIFLYNITLKHNSIKKPDSPDITIDVYCFTDTSSCLFWKNQLEMLYHQSGGEPLKELFFIKNYGTTLLHTTTRAFMWEDELNSVYKACNNYFEDLYESGR